MKARQELAGMVAALGLATIFWSIVLRNPPGGELGVALFTLGAIFWVLP